MEGPSAGQRLLRRGISVVVALFCLSTLFHHAGATINSADSSALNALRNAFGANNLKWNSGDPCTSRWNGVFCDSRNTTVITLTLTNMGLSGQIPSAIGSFTNLSYLELSFNNLLGGLPSELGQLATLSYLSIQSCGLTGSIPTQIGNLTKLTFLALNNNSLSGNVPSSLGALSLLYWLDLSNNNLTGELPVSTTSTDGYGLDTMTKCMHFHFNNNSLSGNLPSELGGGSRAPLTQLIHMLFDNNMFSGSIPASYANLTGLQIMSLSNNQLSGPIPTSLSSVAMINLQQLLVRNNKLTGTIPDFTALSNLLVVDFSYNYFDQQPFPSWLPSAQQLSTVYLEKANLIGKVPDSTLNLSALQTLWIRNNSMNGSLTIPDPVGQNLQLVSLQDNQITNLNQVNVSASLNTSVTSVELFGNPICIATNLLRPSEFCDNATGSLEAWTTPLVAASSCASVSCSGTSVLNLQNYGNCNCSDPLRLVFEARRPSFSVITDSLMATLQTELYPQLGLLSQQVYIYAASFTADQRANIWIFFFSADVVSELDPGIQTNITSSLTRQLIILPEFTPYQILQVNSSFVVTSTSKRFPAGAIAGIVVGGLALLAVIVVYAFWQKRRADRLKHITQPFAAWGGGGDEGEAPQIAGARYFSFSEMKKATNNFSDANEIGAGGYGKVYKGVLPSGEQVAVKRAQEGSMQGALEFKTEIELLSRVHHKNLVGLVGYCYDQGEQMLVYEFMVNGTMREWLAGKKAYPLDWSKRLSIAVGSARGLAYLHELANPPIIHRDIKSSNILLDEKHVAKVADFGLSKVTPEGTDQLQMEDQVKGTLGYLDPEYYMTQQLSDKSDVYSFGVVLLELITSRAPIEHGKYIVREVQTAREKGGNIDSVLDPSVFEANQEDLDRYLDLALACVEEKGVDRPSMNEVVKELEALAEHNKPKAKVSAQNTDRTWLEDVFGDEDYVNEKADTSFQYTGSYTPQRPQAK